MRHAFFVLLFLALSLSVKAQVYTFADDALERGYYTRPYQRYEAEADLCTTNGTFLTASDDQSTVQSEASHQQALQLTAVGDYVSWQLGSLLAEGDETLNIGLTLRFSLPDADDGAGHECRLRAELVQGEDKNMDEDKDGTVVASSELNLSSYWAWQYTAPGGNYPDNLPAANKMVRMRFDETHILLRDVECRQGSSLQLRLTKLDADDLPLTIDFAEVETVAAPLTAADIDADDLVVFNPLTDGDIADFIKANAGKHIFLPEGRHETPKRIYLNHDDTHLIGAGEWYTEIFFSASSDSKATYSFRGIECNASRCSAQGLYLNTINNRRYYDNNSSYQVGKGFMGSWGSDSQISHCWVEHFECGAWIASYGSGWSENLMVEHCRLRNNYADGINFSQRCRGNTIRYSSLRNNGDDDLATWTTTNMNSNCTFAYCTAENNWRASSLGIFGGEAHHAHHLAIYDGLECGVRVNADFSGRGFSDKGVIHLHDISILHCGCKSGSRGKSGDFWGNMQGAMNIGSTANYDVRNIRAENIDIYDTRSNAIYLRAAAGHKLVNIILKDINIDTAQQYGIYYAAATGNARYCNIRIDNCRDQQNSHLATFVITESCDEDDTAINEVSTIPTGDIRKYLDNACLLIETHDAVYSANGALIRRQ